MLWTARRTAATAIALTLVGACASERSAPVATRPPSPSTTTTTSVADRIDRVRPVPDHLSPPDRLEAAVESIPGTTSTTVPGVAPFEAWAAFDQALSGRLIGSGDLAAAVAVAVDGEIVHTAEFGYRVPPPPPPATPPAPLAPDVSSSVPASTPPPSVTTGLPTDVADPIAPGDRFRIASISKVITAIVVLQLVEAGQLHLDEPIGLRLATQVGVAIDDPAVAGITVRQLLSHTTGFPSYQQTFFGGQVDSCGAAAQRGLSAGLAAPPGASYRYSNLNFCLLGLLVEQVAGRPYEAVVKDRLLAPLGIEGMRLVKTFDPDPAEVVHPSVATRNYMEVLGAAGSWVATPADIVTIIDSLDPSTPGFHPLSPPMIDLMRQPVPTVPYPRPGRWYGLGLMAFGDGSFGHTGTVENTHAMVVERPDGVTWSVLVSGQYPGESSDLRSIVDRSLADAGITFS